MALNSAQRRHIYTHTLALPPGISDGGRIGGQLAAGVFYEADMLVHIHQRGIGGIYVDVGANIGNHMMFFATKTKAEHVFAVEPIPSAVATCVEFARLNGLSNKISVIPFAAGAQRDTIDFTYQISTGRDRQGRAACVRLDDVIPGGVKLIKMDIEGAEPDALRGATRILLQDRPLLYVEAHTEPKVELVMAVLRPLGYERTGKVFNHSPTHEIAPVEVLESLAS